jgi:hypothetical protein
VEPGRCFSFAIAQKEHPVALLGEKRCCNTGGNCSADDYYVVVFAAHDFAYIRFVIVVEKILSDASVKA